MVTKMLRVSLAFLYFFLCFSSICAFLLESGGTPVFDTNVKLTAVPSESDHIINFGTLLDTISAHNESDVTPMKETINYLLGRIDKRLPGLVTVHARTLTPSSATATATFPVKKEGHSRFYFTDAVTDNINAALSAVIETTSTTAKIMVQRYPDGEYTTSLVAVVALDVPNTQTNKAYQVFQYSGATYETTVTFPYECTATPFLYATCVEPQNVVTHLWQRSPATTTSVVLTSYKGTNHQREPCPTVDILLLNSDLTLLEPSKFQFGITASRTVTFDPAFASTPVVIVKSKDTDSVGAFCSMTAVSPSSASFICRYKDVQGDSYAEFLEWAAFLPGDYTLEI